MSYMWRWTFAFSVQIWNCGWAIYSLILKRNIPFYELTAKSQIRKFCCDPHVMEEFDRAFGESISRKRRRNPCTTPKYRSYLINESRTKFRYEENRNVRTIPFKFHIQPTFLPFSVSPGSSPSARTILIFQSGDKKLGKSWRRNLQPTAK